MQIGGVLSMAKALAFAVLLAALMISASATVGFSNIALVRADDDGSDSDSDSSSGSNDNGDSSPNDSSGSSDNNNNGNTDNGNNDIGSTEPSKEDPKPVVGEDPTKIDSTLPGTTIVPQLEPGKPDKDFSGSSDSSGSDSSSSDKSSNNNGDGNVHYMPTSEAIQETGVRAQPIIHPVITEPGKTGSEKLPKCDGSFQDCVTRNGDTCKAGQGGHECECAEDMSDCSNHTSLTEQLTKTQTPDMSNPVKHPGPHCPPGYKVKHGICSTVTVIKVHTHNHSSGNSNSNTHSELSDNCYSEIKMAWIGKIQRGTNQAVDSIIDRCMGLA